MMSGKKAANGFLAIVSGLILIAVMLLTVIELCVFDLNFFRSEYNKLDTVSVTGMPEKDLMVTTTELLAYIQGDKDNLEIRAEINGQERQVFNQREIVHMADVQRLYLSSRMVRNAGLIVLFLFLILLRISNGKKYFRSWASGFLAAAVIFLCIFGAVGIAVWRDFQVFWDSFHYLIFTNDLWLLDPETDILIQMVPEQFFFDLVIRILALFGSAVLILALVAARIRFVYQKV
ncbi:TIGR01906 family membrane protein [Dehalobacter sp. 12DCB1]|uniref:TIGR01906 family membrane protein n=1 Tax=Dehalobacter sp. 12DCB1 TaxID=2070364 RepID=UPI001FAAD726|nr:TIGR01906 family membrane protein [Dehalobacter sp. 12DCB1]